jgi:hypothetical protein
MDGEDGERSMKIITSALACTLLFGLGTQQAWADKSAYCAAYARDFADARTLDKAMWQHKYDIALQSCLTPTKPMVQRVPPAAKKVAEPVKPAIVKQAEPPAPEAKVAEATADKPATAAPKQAYLAPGSNAWNDYCAKKYSSFNIKTGTYTSKTGVERKCLVTAN